VAVHAEGLHHGAPGLIHTHAAIRAEGVHRRGPGLGRRTNSQRPVPISDLREGVVVSATFLWFTWSMVARMRTWVSPRTGVRWSQGALLVAALSLGTLTTTGVLQLAFATLLSFSLLVAWAIWPLRELTRR
jgi:hypothetical protein